MDNCSRLQGLTFIETLVTHVIAILLSRQYTSNFLVNRFLGVFCETITVCFSFPSLCHPWCGLLSRALRFKNCTFSPFTSWREIFQTTHLFVIACNVTSQFVIFWAHIVRCILPSFAISNYISHWVLQLPFKCFVYSYIFQNTKSIKETIPSQTTKVNNKYESPKTNIKFKNDKL